MSESGTIRAQIDVDASRAWLGRVGGRPAVRSGAVMRRIGLWSFVAVLAGCSGDGAAPSTAAGTVAVGELPGTLPAPRTTTTASTTPATTAVPAPTVLATSLAALFDGATAPPPPMAPIADDSGRLQMLVPADWGDRRTTPSVAASTDLAAFLDGYDAPGTTAVVVDELPVEALRAYDFAEDCEPAGEGGYETERLEGEYRAWRRCGGTGTSIVAVAAETGGGDTVVVLAQLLGPGDLAALDATLASIAVT